MGEGSEKKKASLLFDDRKEKTARGLLKGIQPCRGTGGGITIPIRQYTETQIGLGEKKEGPRPWMTYGGEDPSRRRKVSYSLPVLWRPGLAIHRRPKKGSSHYMEGF